MITRLTGFFCGLLSIISVQAQNYQISFTATGASTVIDSVKVENLTQCTQTYAGGEDILYLELASGKKDIDNRTDNSLSVFPNPHENYCNIELEVPLSGMVSIEISDMKGNVMLRSGSYLQQGKHKYLLSGMSSGVYAIQIKTEECICVGKILNIGASGTTPCISYQGFAGVQNEVEEHKPGNDKDGAGNMASAIHMQYHTGDILKLTGLSGIFRTVFMLVPASGQTVSFTFIPCTDDDGNNYAVVKIGNQWWMAENLNSGTFAGITSPQVSGTKFCMDINGQEDPDCPMGGLYEWDNLMQDTGFCNGTGAYPNDRCSDPVQGLCPDGWHIPSHYEWNTLSANSGDSPQDFPYNMSLGFYGVDEGGNLKKKCTTDWWNPNFGATDKTGFGAVPGGDTWAGVFEDFGQSAYFWTSTASDYIVYYTPWVYALNYSLSTIGRSEYVKENGFSCRCIKD